MRTLLCLGVACVFLVGCTSGGYHVQNDRFILFEQGVSNWWRPSVTFASRYYCSQGVEERGWWYDKVAGVYHESKVACKHGVTPLLVDRVNPSQPGILTGIFNNVPIGVGLGYGLSQQGKPSSNTTNQNTNVPVSGSSMDAQGHSSFDPVGNNNTVIIGNH